MIESGDAGAPSAGEHVQYPGFGLGCDVLVDVGHPGRPVTQPGGAPHFGGPAVGQPRAVGGAAVLPLRATRPVRSEAPDPPCWVQVTRPSYPSVGHPPRDLYNFERVFVWLGLSSKAPRNWRRRHENGNRTGEVPLDLEERARLRETERPA